MQHIGGRIFDLPDNFLTIFEVVGGEVKLADLVFEADHFRGIFCFVVVYEDIYSFLEIAFAAIVNGFMFSLVVL